MFRFTLRSLLIIVTLCCVGLGVWTYRAREQRRIVQALRDAGALVFYDSESAEAAIMAWPAVEWLGIDYFKSVMGVEGCPIELMEEAARLDNLITLGIVGHSPPHRFDCLARLTRLRNLTLHESPGVDDATLKCIAALPALESIFLGGEYNYITRAGFECLARSESLEYVHIIGCSDDLSLVDVAPLRSSTTITHVMVVRGYRFSGQAIAQWGF